MEGIDIGMKPDVMKMMLFEDLLDYAFKNRLMTTRTFLIDNGLSLLEATWIMNNRSEEIHMQNKKIQADVNNEEIVRLNKIIQELEYLKNKPLKETMHIEKDGIKNWKISMIGKSETKKKNIDNKDVQALFKILLKLHAETPMIKYRDIAREIISKHKLDINVDAFNGGKNRSKYFFKLYYYPLKILEHLNYVRYKKHGEVEVLKQSPFLK